MSELREQVKHALLIRFGLVSPEPTNEQLDNISQAVKELKEAGYGKSQIDERLPDIVKKYCLSYGKMKYAAEDLSDLVDLMVQLLDTLGS